MVRHPWRAAFMAALVLTIISAALPPAAHAASAVEDFFTTLFGPAPGTSNRTTGRRIVAFSQRYKTGQVIVSFGDRRLYYVAERGRALSYPISVPRSQSRWQGTLKVSRKKVNPTWTPTAEMRRDNPRLPRVVPGGHPQNPLGYRALYLGNTLYRIHGTDAPWTIGKAVSRGCVRMLNADVADLYNRVPVGTTVTVTWQRFARS